MLTFEALTLSILNIAIKQSRNSFLEANCCLFYNISCCPIFEPFPVLQPGNKKECVCITRERRRRKMHVSSGLSFFHAPGEIRAEFKKCNHATFGIVFEREGERNNGSENFSLLRLLLLAWKLSPFPKLSISGLECAKERPCVGMKES